MAEIFDENAFVDIVPSSMSADAFRDIWAALITNIQKLPGEQRRPFIVTLNQWKDLVNKYNNNEASIEDLQNFDPGVLAGTDQWNQIYTGIIDGLGESTTTEDPALGELISTYGQEAVDDAQRKLKELEKILGQTIDDPLGTLEGIIQKTKTSSSTDPCNFQSVPGGTGIEEWVLDCATVGVGLPVPFPIPGPLGSIFKGATVREIKDAIENAGYEIGKVLRGETPIDEVFDKIVDGVVTKVKDIFKDADEVSIDSILGTIGDILVGGGYILAGDLYDEYFKDKVNSVIPNVPIIPFDSSQECRDSERYTLNAEGQCGACIDPNKIYDPSQDKCVPKDEDDEEDGVSLTEQEELCKRTGREYDELNDICKQECKNPDYIIKADGNCGPAGEEEEVDEEEVDEEDVDDDVIVDDGIDCSSPVPVLPYATLIDRKTAWNNKCIPQGYCPAPPDETPTLALDHQDGDCKKPLITDGDGTTTVEGCQSTVPGSSEDANGNCVCPEGYEPTRDGKNCRPKETVEDTDDDDDVVVEPVDKECDNGAINPPDCNQCPSGKILIRGQCTDIPTPEPPVEPPEPEPPEYTCDDPNATVQQGGLTPGACGPCKEGYVYDGSVERCVQEEVTAPPPEPPPPEEPPPEEPPPEPPSSGGGGGGGGMFTFEPAEISVGGDPQLLARTEFPIVDYLSESLAQQTKNQLMTGMLTGNIV